MRNDYSIDLKAMQQDLDRLLRRPEPIKKMPFGKHKGKYLSGINSGYLAWVLEECNINYSLRTAIEEVLKRKRR